MNALSEFCKPFGGAPDSVVQIKKKFYYDPEHLNEAASKNGWEPSSVGILLGEDKRGFRPTPALLDLLQTKKKVVLKDDAAWLFLCGKDALMAGVQDAGPNEGRVLVTDLHGNVLGYGDIKNPFNKEYEHKIFVKNRMDKGDYLRRER